MTQRVVVVGGGPAGIEAAASAAQGGASVTLVSEGPIGGRAGWDSLVPSKVWIGAADLVGELHAAEARGVAGLSAPQLEPTAVLARIREAARSWGDHEARRLADLGVRVVTGTASFAGPRRLSVRAGEGQPPSSLEADAVIIASGSVPRFPPALRPDGRRVLAPRFMSALERLPADMVVVGGGATGSEFASLFSRLGVRVTWLVAEPGVLPMLAPAAGQELAAALAARGVAVHVGPRAERIEPAGDGVAVVTADGASFGAATAFLAVGRSPDLGRLDLAAAGLSARPDGTLPADGYGRTAAPGIYVAGDAAGGPMLANRAMAQGRIAGRHAAGLPVAPHRPETVVHAVYSDPEVAQVGDVAGQAGELLRVRAPFAAGLKAHLLPAAGGWLELTYEPAGGRVRGAVAVGPHAADLLAPVALAIELGATMEQLGAVFGAHPASSELAFIAARRAG